METVFLHILLGVSGTLIVAIGGISVLVLKEIRSDIHFVRLSLAKLEKDLGKEVRDLERASDARVTAMELRLHRIETKLEN